MKISKLISKSIIALFVLALFALPAYAANATLFAAGVTSPAGMVKMGNTTWVSDHLNGFCRLDPDPLIPVLSVNLSTCINAESATGGPTSPGQPVSDAANNFVYVPDNAATVVADAATSGVWRLTFNPATQIISQAVLIANMTALGADKPTAAALGSDGRLYVGFIGSGDIVNITSPEGAPGSQVVGTFGTTSDGNGVSAIAFASDVPAGSALYLAEAAAVTKIPFPAGGIAVAFSGNLTALTPTAIASDGADKLFIANTPLADSTILRFTISTDALDFFAFNGIQAGRLTPLEFVTGLFVDAAGNLFIGDDPTEGIQSFTGHIWFIPAGALPEVAPPPSPALRNATLYAFGTPAVPVGITSPGGMVWLGTHLWVSDHLSGFCRLDRTTNPLINFTLFTINQTTCVNAESPLGGPTSPGQPSFDGTFIYVPDNAAAKLGGVAVSQGVWRLTFNPTTETIVNAEPLPSSASLAGNKPTASALGPDGKLYIGSIRSNQIVRITSPGGPLALQTSEVFGNTSDGLGVSAIAFAGSDLYLAETAAVTKIGPAGGTAVAVPGITVTVPTAIASFGANTLFIADTPAINSNVLRFNISTGTQDPLPFASAGFFPPQNATKPFQFATGLAFDPQGTLFIGDDPSEGVLTVQGRIWNVTGATVANGNITGTVRSAATNLPIAGATVSAGGITATTDAAGVYILSLVPATYTVTARAVGFSPLSATVTVISGQTVTQNFALQAGAIPVLTTITVAPSTPTVVSGSTQTFTAAGSDQFGDPILIAPPVFWSSSNTNVGTIDGTGLFTANKVGTTIIAARNGSTGTVQGTATVTVVAGTLAAITVMPGNPTVGVNTTISFVALGADAAGNAVTITPTWRSSNPTIGDINPAGVFIASLQGTTTITASNTTPANQRIQGTTTVTVGAAVANGNITGTVTRNATGAAIANATVSVVGASATTDAAGSYSLNVIPATYIVTASATGFVSNSTSVTVAPGTTATLNFVLQQASPAAQFDINGNGFIERTEAVTAVVGFFAGTVAREIAVQVVVVFFSQTPV